MDQLKNVATDSKTKSLVETSLDIFLGFMMFLPVNYFVLPLFAEQIADHSLLTAIQIGVDRGKKYFRGERNELFQ